MPTDLRGRLARIRRFDQLVAFLRDELDWPIGTTDFDDLTFEYTAEELGIDDRNAVKIQEIKRLRPLAPGQPWGVFFVKFQPKRLPVVALRRILSQVAIKARPSAHAAEHQSWAPDDLLFVSNYGEGDRRRIAFAHFSKPRAARDLPTLKVLGWDNLDTALHLDDVAQKLTEHLAWPDDEDDAEAWRERWRAAFRLRHREVVTTSKVLSARLAELAQAIRDRACSALDIEAESGPLTRLMKAFQTALLDDLDATGFADMYAQTITYGLLSARIADPGRKTADGLAAQMRRTNPFLGELMKEFLHAGGDPGEGVAAIDFDELGISEVVELLDNANMEAVVLDFGDKNPEEDPVIHFYEHFLAAYDKDQKVSRGVFYTPRPVVSYIVRSVDELLRGEFGLEDGLADTTTWGEMAARREGVETPDGTPPDQPFVQILDPAAGTGTFLVEVIDLIHETMVAKWRERGCSEDEITARWNDYVPKHLLPRLHGYELLMAPYAIAHLKIGLKLHETGYRFESDERAQVYLTDALEPPAKTAQFTMDFLPALAREAEAVGRVKRTQRFTVVIGNPPYLGEAGRGGEWIASLMRGVELPSKRRTLSYFEVDGKPLGEKNPKWVNNLYVRFTRLSQHLIERAGLGVHGFITAHSYIDNPTFRGMRWALLSAFDQLAVVDLHGSLKKKEEAPDGSRDENVFDIEQGVAIGLFVKSSAGGKGGARVAASRVRHTDLWGARANKYDRLLRSGAARTAWAEVRPRPSFFVLKPFAADDTYGRYWSIKDVMPVNGVGMTTARDRVVIDFDRRPLLERAREFRDSTDSDEDLCRRLRIPLKQGWSVPNARKLIKGVSDLEEEIKAVLYRPFDQRLIFYHDSLVWRTVKKIMGHMLEGWNLGMCVGRAGQVIGADEWDVVTACSSPTDLNLFRRGGNCLFPLYLYPGVGVRTGELLFSPWPKGKDGRRPNLDPGFVQRLAEASDLRFVSDGRGNLRATFGPEDVLAYIYAVFHSPGYRERYEAHLKLDFPRIPVPQTAGVFRQLAIAGHDLFPLHLIESPALDHSVTDYAGPKAPRVGRVGWSNGTVWLDAAKTNARQRHRATKPGQYGFHGVPEDVWDFQIGGYQICHKWLKDRKDRTLSDDDIAHYQKIVVSLNETIRIMAAIDEAVDAHGGWPHAFETKSEAAPASEGTAKVVPFRPHTVEPAPRDRYVTCLPLVPLRAAAGGFSDAQYIQDDDFEWVTVDSQHRLRKGMFVAQVTGKSMEPAVQDGAWCVFRGPVEGTRQGKIVLVQLRDATDPETGQRYTVKRYASEKVREDDSWRHVKITLKPANPDFEPIVLSGADEGELQVIAELVEVLEG